MKNIISSVQGTIFLLATLISIILLSSSCKSAQLTEEEKSAREQTFREAEQAINDNDFIVAFTGSTQVKLPITTFLLVENNLATIQIGDVGGTKSGMNGLGGETVEGTVLGLKTRHNNKGSLILTANIVQKQGRSALTLELYKDSNDARITIIPEKIEMVGAGGSSLIMNGKVLRASDTEYVKGVTY